MPAAKRPTSFLLPLIGWKEYVMLPRLGIGPIVAKIDTGARSAALHADEIKVRGKSVSFAVRSHGRTVRHKAPLLAFKKIKSSNGHSEERPVIEAVVMLGGKPLTVDVTLTDRADMGVAMLLGRNSIRKQFLVNPARTFLLSRKTRALT